MALSFPMVFCFEQTVGNWNEMAAIKFVTPLLSTNVTKELLFGNEELYFNFTGLNIYRIRKLIHKIDQEHKIYRRLIAALEG